MLTHPELYENQWKGKVDSEDGWSLFRINGVEYRFHLENFHKHQELLNMLSKAYQQGVDYGENNVKGSVRSVLDL